MTEDLLEGVYAAFFKTDYFFYVEINSYRRNIPGDSTPGTHHLTTSTSAKHHHHDSLNPAATAHHIHIIQPNTSIISNINTIVYMLEAGLCHIFDR